jgi:patatin-related protein
MLSAGGWETVLVDVITGASAGGLNGVLYASALRSGASVDDLRRVWLQRGSMARLLADREDPRHGVWSKPAEWLLGPLAPIRNSVFDGEYFKTSLEKEVRKLTEPAKDSRYIQHHDLSLFLAGTILGGAEVVSRDDPWSLSSDRRLDAVFQFRHAGAGPELSSINQVMSPTLALAARTTASFPLAFEPVRWTRRCSHGSLLGPDSFLDGSPELMDGGVVDNIPVERAIGAIVRSAAATATARWLLYLHPSPGPPKKPVEPAKVTDPSSTLVTVGKKLLGSLHNESVMDDLDVLRSQNDRARLLRAARTAAITEGLGADRGLAVHRLGPDAAADAARLYRLLADPKCEIPWFPMGAEILASPLETYTDDNRRRLRRSIALTLSQSDQYHVRVGETVALPSLGSKSIRPFLPVIRTALLIVDWVAEIRRGDDVGLESSTEDTLDVAKAVAYSVHKIGEQLQAFLDRRAVLGAAALQGDEVDWWLTSLFLDSARLRAEAPIDELARLGELETWERDGCGIATTLRAIAADTYRPVDVPVPSTTDALATLWSRLVDAATNITLAMATEMAQAPVGPLQRDLEKQDSEEKMAVVLDRLDRATLGVHAGGPGASSTPIRFTRVSGANLSPLLLRSCTLPGGRAFSAPEPNLARLADRWLVPGTPVTVNSKHKLAGGQLGNFTAFMSGRWRQNDWMWGEMDAAKSLLDIVLDPEQLIRFHTRSAGETRDSAGARLYKIIEQTVCEGPGGSSQESRSELWSNYHSEIRSEIEEFFRTSGEDPDGDALALTKTVLLCRRHWDLMADDLPLILATPLRDDEPNLVVPTEPPQFKPSMIDAYAKMAKDIKSVWGREWVSTLGMTAMSQLLASLTPPLRRGNSNKKRIQGYFRGLIEEVVFFPLKAAILALTGLVLARTRGIVALAFLINLVILPRLSPGGRWVVWSVTIIVLLPIYILIRPGILSRSSETPKERRHHLIGEGLTILGGVGAMIFGLLLCLDVGHLVVRFYPDALRTPPEISHILTVPYIVSVVVGGGMMMWLLWGWATYPRRALAAGMTAGILCLSAYASLHHYRPHRDHFLWSLVTAFGSLWWGLIATLFLTVTWAVKRRPVRIARESSKEP